MHEEGADLDVLVVWGRAVCVMMQTIEEWTVAEWTMRDEPVVAPLEEHADVLQIQ